MAVLVILVPASAPVGDHDFRLLFANGIAQTQGALLRERYFGIRVEQEDCLRPQQARCFLGGSALHFAVLFHWDVLRRTPLAQRKAQDNSCPSALDLLRNRCAHSEEPIARMCRDSHDFAGHYASEAESIIKRADWHV